MIYRYIGHNDIEELRRNYRKAFIINNVEAKDIGEYINNFVIVLKNMGVDTNILNIPKVKKLNSNHYNILFSVRATESKNYKSIGWMMLQLQKFNNITYIN